MSAVIRPRRLTTGEFFGEGGRVFWRLIRLVFFGLLTMGLLAALPTFGIWKGLSVFIEDRTDEKIIFGLRMFALGLSFLLFAYANAVYDLMRVEAIHGNEHRARWAGCCP